MPASRIERQKTRDVAKGPAFSALAFTRMKISVPTVSWLLPESQTMLKFEMTLESLLLLQFKPIL